MHELGAEYVEYRDTNRAAKGWTTQAELYATFCCEMEVEADRQLKQIPRKQRAVLRKAMTVEGMTWALDEDPQHLYRLYALSVRNLGTPVFPIRYFLNLKEEFGDFMRDSDRALARKANKQRFELLLSRSRDALLYGRPTGSPDAWSQRPHVLAGDAAGV